MSTCRLSRPIVAFVGVTLSLTVLGFAAEEKQKIARQLQVVLAKTSYLATETIGGKISLKNKSTTVVAIAKPLFPTSWTVVFRVKGGKEKPRTWEGSVVRGTTHLGAPPRYDENEYALIKPGETYEEDIDLGAYLRNDKELIDPGTYEIEFHYSHTPNESERDLPLIADEVISNVVHVSILTSR